MHNLRIWLVGLIASLTLAAGLAATAPAQAWTGGSASGSMNYSEYTAVWHHETPGTIAQNCNCTGVSHRSSQDSPYEWIIYTANNSAFAWDICQTAVWFTNIQGLGWVAMKGAPGDANVDHNAKARIGCNGTYYYDDLAPAPSPV